MEKGEKYDIQFRENIGIGRAENVRGIERFLTIHNDMRISGYHCRIYAFNSQIYIEDTGSKEPYLCESGTGNKTSCFKK